MTDHCDVIVVGSGAGGGTLTYALALPEAHAEAPSLVTAHA